MISRTLQDSAQKKLGWMKNIGVVTLWLVFVVHTKVHTIFSFVMLEKTKSWTSLAIPRLVSNKTMEWNGSTFPLYPRKNKWSNCDHGRDWDIFVSTLQLFEPMATSTFTNEQLYLHIFYFSYTYLTNCFLSISLFL